MLLNLRKPKVLLNKITLYYVFIVRWANGVIQTSFNYYRNKILALKHNRKMDAGMFKIASRYVKSIFEL